MSVSATILGCEGPVLGREERAFYRAADPWGFILFARNVDTPAQLARLTADLREAVGRDAPVFIDQEGGRVARMQAPHWRTWLPPLDHVARAAASGSPGWPARSMWLRYRLIAYELASVGIDGNCAPLGDIACPATHPFLRNRCYGETPALVAEVARAVADALLAGGVLPVVKHMPGHGRAAGDSHTDLPRAEAARAELAATDFAPFRALADLPLGMTAHVVYPALDLAAPATLSRAAIRAVRDEIGFSGLLMTDDIAMGALSGSLEARVRGALAAGCDVVLHCNGRLAEMEEVVAAAGRLTEAGQARAAAALSCRGPAQPIDIPALEAELEALLAGRENA
ncbi:MAG: beta-hexosaminidase [Rhodobacteraceae bacterium]|jgi:beta-N-acetylhexosaminidase|nr:beta-hexosaminidase [Paracoccaceae bacterium]